MTLKIERLLATNGSRIRLSGELRLEQLDDVSAEIASSASPLALDLDELGHVDVNAVRFLIACEREGIELTNCSPFIREWMAQERARRKIRRERSNG